MSFAAPPRADVSTVRAQGAERKAVRRLGLRLFPAALAGWAGPAGYARPQNGAPAAAAASSLVRGAVTLCFYSGTVRSS